ncbi:DUF4170 domain-containing protein [Pseudomonas sp. R2.Fl]|nr:DUF4170 domain-containing protein [Pseudomonas sp. R2.Fl]
MDLLAAVDLWSEIAQMEDLLNMTGKNSLMTESDGKKQLLHLVFGGELSNLSDVQFRDLKDLDIVGIFPDYASALTAWKAKAQQTVDNAHMRYFIVHMHRLLNPAENS